MYTLLKFNYLTARIGSGFLNSICLLGVCPGIPDPVNDFQK